MFLTKQKKNFVFDFKKGFIPSYFIDFGADHSEIKNRISTLISPLKSFIIRRLI